MTTEELNAIKWQLASHLSMPKTHYSVYVGEYNGITIMVQTATRVLECGSYGKTRVAYGVRGRKFKTKEELIKYLNELAPKGDAE